MYLLITLFGDQHVKKQTPRESTIQAPDCKSMTTKPETLNSPLRHPPVLHAVELTPPSLALLVRNFISDSTFFCLNTHSRRPTSFIGKRRIFSHSQSPLSHPRRARAHSSQATYDLGNSKLYTQDNQPVRGRRRIENTVPYSRYQCTGSSISQASQFSIKKLAS